MRLRTPFEALLLQGELDRLARREPVHAIVELDPSVVDPSFVSDRMLEILPCVIDRQAEALPTNSSR